MLSEEDAVTTRRDTTTTQQSLMASSSWPGRIIFSTCTHFATRCRLAYWSNNFFKCTGEDDWLFSLWHPTPVDCSAGSRNTQHAVHVFQNSTRSLIKGHKGVTSLARTVESQVKSPGVHFRSRLWCLKVLRPLASLFRAKWAKIPII